VSMGAVYVPNWGRGCTHLVAAFANTPKHQEVLAFVTLVSCVQLFFRFIMNDLFQGSRFGIRCCSITGLVSSSPLLWCFARVDLLSFSHVHSVMSSLIACSRGVVFVVVRIDACYQTRSRLDEEDFGLRSGSANNRYPPD
jgi:hypothetical protein